MKITRVYKSKILLTLRHYKFYFLEQSSPTQTKHTFLLIEPEGTYTNGKANWKGKKTASTLHFHGRIDIMLWKDKS